MADNPDIAGAMAGAPEEAGNVTLEAVYDIPVQLSVILGKTTMQVSQLLKLGRGAVVELDRKVGEPIDIFVNNRLIAKGEVVVVERPHRHHHDGNHQTGESVMNTNLFQARGGVIHDDLARGAMLLKVGTGCRGESVSPNYKEIKP